MLNNKPKIIIKNVNLVILYNAYVVLEYL